MNNPLETWRTQDEDKQNTTQHNTTQRRKLRRLATQIPLKTRMNQFARKGKVVPPDKTSGMKLI